MTSAPAPEPVPFERGPPHCVASWLGLIRSGSPQVPRRAALVVAVSWVPLALLTLAHGDFLRADAANAFALDFGAWARFVIAAPLLVLAESLCAPRLRHIARQFVAAGLVSEAERAAYDRAVESTRRLLLSRAAELVAFILAYLFAASLYFAAPAAAVPAWHGVWVGGHLQPTPAGWWALLVSLPLLLVLQLGWLWRIALWSRFLWLMNRLPLRLIPSHPDRAAGLKFLDISLLAAVPLGFVAGVMAGGMVFNQVVHHGASPLDFKFLALGVAVFVIVLFVAPLLVFVRRLGHEQHRGVFGYGALAGRVGEQLEEKWLQARIDAKALEVSDFSATTDLYSISANVYAMARVPVDPKSLVILVGATLLPFLPAVLVAVPAGVLLKKVAGLFL